MMHAAEVLRQGKVKAGLSGANSQSEGKVRWCCTAAHLAAPVYAIPTGRGLEGGFKFGGS